MKPFSTPIFAFTALLLLSACSTPQASVTNTDDWAMDDEMTSSAHSGPYLEDTDSDEDSVELHLNASGSFVQP